jgi:glycosyltransferase involved in cell wall biosynthesis
MEQQGDSRSLRILWISHLIPWPPKGGVLQRSYNLLREAAKRHTVTLAALNQRAILATEAEVREAVAALEPLCAEVRVCEIPSNRSPLVWAGVVAASAVTRHAYDAVWLRSAQMRSILAELRAAGRFDLVHLDTVGLYPYAAGFGATPLALTHHNVESDMMAARATREQQPLKRWYFGLQAGKLARLERAAAAEARVNLVVSDLDGERLRRIVPGCAVRTIANGVDIEYFRPGPGARPAPRSLAFVGGMSWYPNRDAMQFFAREIWPRLVAADPSWKAVIVGQNPPPEVLAAVRAGTFEAPGFVDDVRPWFDAAAIYVCPIRTGGGTRLKILDALAMAKPLVATKFAVEGLGLTANEHYLCAETPSEFVAALERLAADPVLRAMLSRNARRIAVEQFSWDIIGERLDRAYRDVVAGAARETN